MARFLVEQVARSRAGAITRVKWSEFAPERRAAVVCHVRVVVAAIRAGDTVHVLIGGLMGHPLVVSPDGETIVDGRSATVLTLALVQDLGAETLYVAEHPPLMARAEGIEPPSAA